jgi:hypothetical protein
MISSVAPALLNASTIAEKALGHVTFRADPLEEVLPKLAQETPKLCFRIGCCLEAVPREPFYSSARRPEKGGEDSL